MTAARISVLLAGVALCVAAFLVETTPVVGGGGSLEGFWLLQGGFVVASSAFAIGAPPRRRKAVLLAIALLVGVAGQLQLTSPLWLQFIDLRPHRLTRGLAPVGVAAIVLQTAVVLVLARRSLRSFVAGARALLTPRTIVVGGVAFALAAAHASPLVERGSVYAVPFVVLVAAAAGIFVLNTLNAALFAAAFAETDAVAFRERLAALVSTPGTDGAPVSTLDRRLPLLLAGFVLVGTATMAAFVFERVAHVPDEGVYLFQARLFAQGRLAAPLPPVPEAFADFLFDMHDGRWFAPTNPGWPAVLSLGVLVGAPWLVNPVLAALGLVLAHALVRRWSDRGTAHVFALLLATSPWYLFLAASQMTHTVTFTLLVGAGVLLFPRSGGPRPAGVAAAGMLLGGLVLVRPLDGLLAGVVAGLWLLVAARPRLRVVVPYSIGCVAGAIWLLPFNAYFTGNPLRDPMADYTDRLWYPGVNAIGFGPDVGNVPNRWGGLDPLPGHGLADVLVNVNQNVYNLNFELFGWATGSLLLIVVHLALGRLNRADRWMAGLGATIAAGYSLYWFSGGPDFGARYWFLVLLPCVWLSARGAGTLVARVRDLPGSTQAAGRVSAALALLAVITLTTFVPWRIAGKYVGYRAYHDGFLRLEESGKLGNAIVLVHAPADSDARSALYLNDPFLPPDRPVYVRDAGPEIEARLREAMPDRPVVHVLGRSVTGDGVRIVERRP